MVANPRDLYKTLKVRPNATLGEIKTQYHRLEHQYQGQIRKGHEHAEILLNDLARAYDVLSDPHKRAEYDLHRPKSVLERITAHFHSGK